VTARADSAEWTQGRALHLKQKHHSFVVTPCPSACRKGCASCIADWLLTDSAEPAEDLGDGPSEKQTDDAADDLWNWRCPCDCGFKVVKARTDSEEWKIQRSWHLKQMHPEYVITPCPASCDKGCVACVADWLLTDTVEPADCHGQDLGNTESANSPNKSGTKRSVEGTEIATSVNKSGTKRVRPDLIWCCPVPGCLHAAESTDESHEMPDECRKHLKLRHPAWCISPCPQRCKTGCSSCVAEGLLNDEGLMRRFG